MYESAEYQASASRAWTKGKRRSNKENAMVQSASNVENVVMKRAAEIGEMLGLSDAAVRDLQIDLSQMYNKGYLAGSKDGHKRGWEDHKIEIKALQKTARKRPVK